MTGRIPLDAHKRKALSTVLARMAVTQAILVGHLQRLLSLRLEPSCTAQLRAMVRDDERTHTELEMLQAEYGSPLHVHSDAFEFLQTVDEWLSTAHLSFHERLFEHLSLEHRQLCAVSLVRALIAGEEAASVALGPAMDGIERRVREHVALLENWLNSAWMGAHARSTGSAIWGRLRDWTASAGGVRAHALMSPDPRRDPLESLRARSRPQSASAVAGSRRVAPTHRVRTAGSMPCAASSDFFVTEIIKFHHALQTTLCQEIVESDNPVQRRALLSRLCMDVVTHGSAVDEIVYSALRAEPGITALVEKASRTLADLKRTLEDLKWMNVDAPVFTERVTLMGQTLEAHVEEEERVLLPALEGSFNVGEQRLLTRRFIEAKARAERAFEKDFGHSA